MKFIYNEIKDTVIKEVIPVHSKDEILIYEGLMHEDGLIKVRPYINIKRLSLIDAKLKPVSDFLLKRKLDSSPLSNLEYTIIKEQMLEGKVSEMVFFLNNKLYWLAFRIERSMEYNTNSDKINDDITRELVFLAKEYTDISKIPEGTSDGSIIYLTEYSLITI